MAKRPELLRIASVVLCLAGLMAFFWSLSIWNQYFDNLPCSPDPATGSIYPRNIHGIAVYQTLKQQSFLDSVDHWSWGIFVFGFALGLIDEWRTGDLRSYLSKRYALK